MIEILVHVLTIYHWLDYKFDIKYQMVKPPNLGTEMRWIIAVIRDVRPVHTVVKIAPPTLFQIQITKNANQSTKTA